MTSGAYPALLYVLLAFHVGTSAVCIARYYLCLPVCYLYRRPQGLYRSS